jgi:hypothetical protein
MKIGYPAPGSCLVYAILSIILGWQSPAMGQDQLELNGMGFWVAGGMPQRFGNKPAGLCNRSRVPTTGFLSQRCCRPCGVPTTG